ncbi:MAG: bifunctional phosphopantothenoylcysteine decarboxylase/phosphopantothenate--cysteine ligase CoaBC [Flavobacteriaceae bacterium]|nr:bifunctional phosphopantothenoylcysteine decarboxylase/phosphopantothenate--cysteine ligase CoaBC [Flavobacteriaceae bacterium]
MFPALHAKKVILGISGSIAAYKTPLLVRALVKAGAEVQVVMTPSSKSFVAPLSLSTVSNKAVYSEFVESEYELWNNHVDLGLWADLMLIAPASANTLSKMAQATCDNLLLAVFLSAKCPVYFAPAMDLDMHEHPATQDAIQRLISRNNIHIPAQVGELASGLQGVGRMQEPDQIVDFLEQDLSSKMPFLGTKIMVTAGPTYEPLDPVRYIGNYSSGKMGYAIANEAASQGAEVILVSGPVDNLAIHPGVKLVQTKTADDMHSACLRYFEDCNILVMAAAVADYKPKQTAEVKIKKKEEITSVELVKTVDILQSLGNKKTSQILVGFALETDNELSNAKEKMKKKNLDAIILNSLADKGAGFQHATNKITFIPAVGEHIAFSLKDKSEVAIDILMQIKTMIDA